MWNTRTEALTVPKGLRCFIELDSRPATFAEVLQGWRSDPEFRLLFNSVLADAPYTAFRLETPPMTTAELMNPFEFVLVDDPRLVRAPEQETFAEYFTDTVTVVVFPNLGNNAILIVPCPIAASSAYGHLAAFVRLAPKEQQQTLWQTIGERMMQRVGENPVWLNTAGAGVAWLHFRLDDRPKYYVFAAYRKIT